MGALGSELITPRVGIALEPMDAVAQRLGTTLLALRGQVLAALR